MEGDEREVRDDTERVRADVGSWPTGRLLSVAARLVEGRFDRFLHGLGLTHAGLICLHHLAAGPMSQRQLAHRCRVTDQTMSRTVERLARTGHVDRSADLQDRRRTVVGITPLGTSALAAARAEEQRQSGHLLGPAFREQLINVIVTAQTDQDPARVTAQVE